MDTEKKIYNTPELAEHGVFSEITHGLGDTAPADMYPSTPNQLLSGFAH